MNWLWQAAILLWALIFFACYLRGWRRLRRRGVQFASVPALASLIVGLSLFCAGLGFPLATLARESMLARTGQYIGVALLGSPLLWLSLPFHTVISGIARGQRNFAVRWFVVPSKLSPLFDIVTSAFVVWFVYLAVLLIWYDAALVQWSMDALWRQHLTISVLAISALLFWQQITSRGPRRYTRTPAVARVGMLLGVEIPNVITGITMAFATTPIYHYYTQFEQTLSAPGLVSHQTASGALMWIFGSVVYITSIVLVVNGLFQREGADQAMPPVDWDSPERFIAPGLEGRLRDSANSPPDWRDV